MPTILEFASFVHMATGCMVGPYLEFTDYINWIEFAGPYKDMPRGDFSTVVPAVIRMFQAFGCMFLHLAFVLVLQVPIQWCGTKEFSDYKTIFHRLGYYNLAMTGQRFMYYSPWCLSDAALIGCGLAYAGTENGEHKWDGMYNISII